MVFWLLRTKHHFSIATYPQWHWTKVGGSKNAWKWFHSTSEKEKSSTVILKHKKKIPNHNAFSRPYRSLIKQLSQRQSKVRQHDSLPVGKLAAGVWKFVARDLQMMSVCYLSVANPDTNWIYFSFRMRVLSLFHQLVQATCEPFPVFHSPLYPHVLPHPFLAHCY